MNILETLAHSRKQDIDDISELVSILTEKNLSISPDRTPLSQSIMRNREGMGIISELKPASPTRGVILDTQQSIKNANMYCIGSTDVHHTIMTLTAIDIDRKIQSMINGDVVGISVLTEPRKFNGSFGNLRKVCDIAPSTIPVLLKDFVIHEELLKLGKLCGASNALLIVGICDPVEMANKMYKIGLEPLVEIHDEADFEKIKPLKALKSELGKTFVIGINNRNLKDLSIDFHATRTLLPKVKEYFGEDQPIITESGVFTRADMVRMEIVGAQAALIGTAIMQEDDITKKIRDLRGVSHPFIKICGIKHVETFEFLGDPLVSSFGIILGVPKSHRNLDIETAYKILSGAPKAILSVIVSKDKTPEDIIEYDSRFHPDLFQIHVPKNGHVEFLSRLPRSIRRKFILPIKKNDEGIEDRIAQSEYIHDVYAILLDASEGSGTPLDREYAAHIIKKFPHMRILLSGGIGIPNVSSILTELNPYGVDCSSSLERKSDNEKDPQLIKEYIDAIRCSIHN